VKRTTYAGRKSTIMTAKVLRKLNRKFNNAYGLRQREAVKIYACKQFYISTSFYTNDAFYTNNSAMSPHEVKFKFQKIFQPKVILYVAVSNAGVSQPYFKITWNQPESLSGWLLG